MARRSAFSVYSELEKTEEEVIVKIDKKAQNKNGLSNKPVGQQQANNNKAKNASNQKQRQQQHNGKAKTSPVSSNKNDKKHTEVKQEKEKSLNGTLNKKENKIIKDKNNNTNTVSNGNSGSSKKGKNKKNKNKTDSLEDLFLKSMDSSEDIVMNDDEQDGADHEHGLGACGDESCTREHKIPMYDSKEEAFKLLEYIIHPTPIEEFFNYLTPAGTQGFAPHYDDIEAFVLQLEGKKHWRVYKPLSEKETLPFVSSRNFKDNEIGAPIIDCVLETGDMLYFPRGFVHQANACDDIHSLHITVSCYQNNTYGHFLGRLLPAAVQIAMQEDTVFRGGMPVGYSNYGGLVSEEIKDRKRFIQKIMYLCEKLVNEYLPIDATIDQTAKQFIHESLPPHLEKIEELFSLHGNGEKWNAKKKRVDCLTEISPDTNVKFIRKDSVRLVVEDGTCRLYYNLENTRVYQEKDPQYLEVDEDALPALIGLLKAYPNFVRVEDLPLETIDEKITVISCLYDKGLLMTDTPLSFDFDD